LTTIFARNGRRVHRDEVLMALNEAIKVVADVVDKHLELHLDVKQLKRSNNGNTRPK